ncbi:MAG: M48 family metallopeptidase [Thermodesulfobacteriota bacterium]
MARNTVKRAFLAVLVMLVAAACASVPITGRRQLSLVPQSQMLSMSQSEYGKFLSENKLSTNQADTRMVKDVGARIQGAVNRYFTERNMQGELSGYKWEFNLVQSKDVNAWCMPGGKVVVYEGLMPVAKDETGLAVVMGHEIAHAIARHGNERMSQQLLAQMGGLALETAIAEKPNETKALYMTAFGLGAQVGVLLPYSRLQESEADRLGLIFMAMAGYDPRQAVAFWERMAQGKKGGSMPEFLSTHPADQTRINNLKKLIPEALQYYQKQ